MTWWLAVYIIGAFGTWYAGFLTIPHHEKIGARAILTFPVWPVWVIVFTWWLARKVLEEIIRLLELAEWKEPNVG